MAIYIYICIDIYIYIYIYVCVYMANIRPFWEFLKASKYTTRIYFDHLEPQGSSVRGKDCMEPSFRPGLAKEGKRALRSTGTNKGPVGSPYETDHRRLGSILGPLILANSYKELVYELLSRYMF